MKRIRIEQSNSMLLFTSNRLAILLMLLSTALYGCGGGAGSADGESVLGSSLSNAFTSETPIAYIKRPLPITNMAMVGENAIVDPLAFNPGAHLYIRSGASINATETNITAQAFPANASYDVKDISVSPDGEKIVFAMHAPEADLDNLVNTWNIWEYDRINNQLRQVISTNLTAEEGDDITPAYLENGDIVFASTRQTSNRETLVDEGKSRYSGQVEEDAGGANEPNHSLTLHTIDSLETINQITFNQSHDFEPLVMQDGNIIYTRWDNINNTDQLSLYSIKPGGSDVSLQYGYHSQANVSDSGPGFITSKRLLPNGNILAITREDTNTVELTPGGTTALRLGGDITEIDINNFIDFNTPTFSNTGLTTSAITSLSSGTVAIDSLFSSAGRYQAAWPLRDGSNRLLVSWSSCRAMDGGLIKPCSIVSSPTIPASPFFGLWMYDPTANTQLPVVLAEEGMVFSDVVAFEEVALFSTTEITDPTLAGSDQAVLNIRSIYDIDGVDSTPIDILTQADPAQTDPATIDAKFLRLVKAVAIPDEDILDFDNSIFGVNNNQLLREIIGYIPIEPDGSVRAIVPANVPLMLSIVDADGKRINQRHENWLHLAPGETLECRGCHANNSTVPHGRLDAQAPSVHLGAPIATLPYPNTDPNLFSQNGGETMAELYAINNSISGRTPSVDVIYNDDWTDDSGALTKAASFSYLYANLLTSATPATIPTTSICQTTWDELCRITINYPDHIQPIWEVVRTPVDDGSGTMTTVDSCVGCHTTNGGTQIPSGQLDLTNNPSDIDADHFTSYRELLRADIEQVDNVGAVADRLWECNQVDPNTMLAIPNDATPDPTDFLREIRNPNTITPSMSEAGANFGASSNFFGCMTTDNSCRANIGEPLILTALPDECIEFAGTPRLSEPVINHNGMLSADELRLIAEWLDIGAQYYNNPFDAP